MYYEIYPNILIINLLTGEIKPGFPSITLPPFTIYYQNHTASFMEICGELGSGIIVVPIVAVLANVAIAKVFSKYFGEFVEIGIKSITSELTPSKCRTYS